MITGHFGLAAGAKSADYRAPLWSLMLATMWLDVVFVPLVLLNIETIETPPGGGYGTSVIHADYTHSLWAHWCCRPYSALSHGGAGIDGSACYLADWRFRTGCLISSSIAATCRSCRET